MIIRRPGLVPYEPTWRAMQEFTTRRDASTPDELWLVQHPPVYTLGQAGKPEHLLQTTDIPLVKIDREADLIARGLEEGLTLEEKKKPGIKNKSGK